MKRNGEPRIGSRWTIDPDLGPLATLAFRLRAEGRSLKEITKATHERLYRDKNSWTTFFRNRSYLGIGKCGSLEIPDHHPAIVDAATFKIVQEISERARQNTPGNLLHPRRLTSPSLLSGLAVCIHCDSAMVKNRAGLNKWPYYICGKKIRISHDSCEGRAVNSSKADQIILEATLSRILTPEFVTELIKEMKSQFANTAELDRREQEVRFALSSVEKSINKLLDAVEETGSHTAKERLRQRENESVRIQADLDAIQAQREAAHFDISREALIYVFDVWRGKIESARRVNDVRGQQNVLRQFIKKIELGYGMARIWYTYPLRAFDNTDKAISPMGAQNKNRHSWRFLFLRTFYKS